MKLTYRRCGDYYLPNIGIPAEDVRPLGKYGRMRMRYLRSIVPSCSISFCYPASS